MPRYTAGITSTAAASGAAYAKIKAGATRRIYVREIGITVAASTLSPVGIGRPATEGTNSATTVPVPEDAGDATTGAVLETAWSVAPTVPAVFMGKMVIPATAGAGFIWTWPGAGSDKCLVVAVSTGIILWNYGGSAGSALDLYIVYEE